MRCRVVSVRLSRAVFGLCALIVGAPSVAADVAIVPQPVQVAECAGSFRLDRGTTLVATRGALGEAEHLAAALRAPTGFPLPVHLRPGRRLASARLGAATRLLEESPSAARGSGVIELRLVDRTGELGTEGYRLEIGPRSVVLTAARTAGLFYAGQTLRQLLPPDVFGDDRATGVAWELPCVDVFDRPRFGWRGAMLDVSRHFLPKEFVLRFLDLLALHKLNHFHWHLTDDQGWRIQIRKYPRLTEIGSRRAESPVRFLEELGFLNLFALVGPQGVRFDGMPHGGFYTQAEVREVVAYARERHIEIVPEIDMPGHIQSAIAAYPELGNTDAPVAVSTTWGIHDHTLDVEEPTIAFLQDVLREVMALFPGRLIHLGGDEVPTKEWEESPAAQARLAELGLEEVGELRGYFLGRMIDFVRGSGRRAIGWNDILTDELDRRTAIMSWIGIQPGIEAALAGHDVVMAPTDATYFDYPQGISPEAERALDELGNGSFNSAPWLTPLDQVYAFDPVPPELEGRAAKHVLGAQGQLWSEFIHDGDEVENRAFPRLAALAEVVWSERQDRDFASFEQRLALHLHRLDVLDVNYFGRVDP
jgi:hexosaminidase